MSRRSLLAAAAACLLCARGGDAWWPFGKAASSAPPASDQPTALVLQFTPAYGASDQGASAFVAPAPEASAAAAAAFAPAGAPPLDTSWASVQAGAAAQSSLLQAQSQAAGAPSGSPQAAQAAAAAQAQAAQQSSQSSSAAQLWLAQHPFALLPLADPLAVCNDGSPAGFYYAAGTDPTKWLVYLEGGMWCWDEVSCAARNASTPFEMSSSGWGPRYALSGVFSSLSTISPMASYNKVYLMYCSSDAWVGDVGASEATFGFDFRGQRIIAATLAALAQPPFGLGTGDELVFGGCSAGARGALFTLDYVAGMVPPGVLVRGLLDSPLWVDVQPISGSETSLQAQTQGAFALLNATARILPACAAAYPGADGWKCLYGQYRLPFVTTPYFLNSAQFDSFQMLYDLGGMPPASQPQVAFADAFQNATRAALWAAAAANPANAIFSATCLTHCLTDATATLQATKADGASAQGALGAWLTNAFAPAVNASAQVVDVSSCIGYPCVAACPGGTAIPNIRAATQSYEQLTGSSQSESSETSGNDSPVAQQLAQQQQQQLALNQQAGAATNWMQLGRRRLAAAAGVRRRLR